MGDQCSKTVEREVLLYKSFKGIDFSCAIGYTENDVPVQPVHSSETQGTKDAGGRVLAMTLRPFVGSDELILDLPVTPCRRGRSLGSFAFLFSFTSHKS